MNIHRFLRALRQRSGIAAALFFLVAAIPLRAQDAPSSPPAAASDRETVDFEGIRITFPKGEADVVERLKPALRKFREERKSVAEAEEKDLAGCMEDTKLRDQLREKIPFFTGRDAVSDRFDARWASQTATMQKLAHAWRQWTGDISELQLWRRDELEPFQTRPDGSDDAEGFSHRFPQVSFGKNGSHLALHPQFLVPLLGLDMMLKLTKETKPLRVDIPIFYKPGESPEKIADYGRKFIEHLPTFIHDEFSRGFGLTAVLPYWLFENMCLGELDASFVEHRTAEETSLADGLARFMLFGLVLKHDGEEKMEEKIPRLFPFGINGWNNSDPAAIIATVEKLDPIAKVERAKVTERLFARNLIAVTLIDIAQKDNTQAPILHKFKKAGVEIPEGGFTMNSFIAAVDTAYGEQGFFLRALKARQAATLEQLRESIARRKKKKEDGESPTVKPPAAPAVMQGRASAKFGGLTISFPPELKAAVEIIGPEYAKVLAKAREAMEALCKNGPPPAPVVVTDADSAALRAYGIEPDADVLRGVAALLGAMQERAQIARWFASADRMEIWIKEDVIAFLKSGGTVTDITLNPDGESGQWMFRFGMPSLFQNAEKTDAKGADAVAGTVKRIDVMPQSALPIIVKRGALPEKLDDPKAVAEAVRAGEGGIFETLRMADQDPEKTAGTIAALLPPFAQEQWWFIAAHEVSENAIVNGVIASADRRWFCDGMANWIAIRDTDRRFGAGKGAEAFAKNYDAAELRKHAAKVDLLAWPVAEAVNDGSRPDVENPPAYYFFATLVIEKACDGRDAGFVKSWLDEIRKTPRSRTNSGTVLAAYQKLTGKNLKDIIAEIVK
jgi:hypothetical protein